MLPSYHPWHLLGCGGRYVPRYLPPPPRPLPAVYHPEQVATDYGQAPEGYEFDRYGGGALALTLTLTLARTRIVAPTPSPNPSPNPTLTLPLTQPQPCPQPNPNKPRP